MGCGNTVEKLFFFFKHLVKFCRFFVGKNGQNNRLFLKIRINSNYDQKVIRILDHKII